MCNMKRHRLIHFIVTQFMCNSIWKQKNWQKKLSSHSHGIQYRDLCSIQVPKWSKSSHDPYLTAMCISCKIWTAGAATCMYHGHDHDHERNSNSNSNWTQFDTFESWAIAPFQFITLTLAIPTAVVLERHNIQCNDQWNRWPPTL